MPDQYQPYIVVRRLEEAPGVSSFFLRPVSGKLPVFIAGQFVNISLPGHTEAKSYTISSAPQDKEVAVTIRAAGKFSTALLAHQAGDRLSLSEPLGYFCADGADAPRLWLAGGIGVTPFISMLRDSSAAQPQTLLYYSNRTFSDAVFKEELQHISATDPRFEVRHFITREPPPEGVARGRIAETDLAAALRKLPDCRVYMCGSIGFVRDYWSLLKKSGVPEERLFTEAFF